MLFPFYKFTSMLDNEFYQKHVRVFQMGKVCIITSAHKVLDARIFYKQAKSLKKNCFDVSLIAPHDKEESIEGIKIIPIKNNKNILYRRTKMLYEIFKKASREKADIYHLHDIELVILGLALKLLGKNVIYDFHEDKYLSIKSRDGIINKYINAHIVNILQKSATKFLYTILAERFYSERINGDILILNYPLKSKFNNYNISEKRNNEIRNILLYTGRVTKSRGAINHVKLLNYINDVEVHLVGYCRKSLAEELRKIAGNNVNRLYIEGENYYVPYERILDYYENERLLAGLSLFPYKDKLMKKELTKFFEYMAAGIPIICSDSYTWTNLIENNGIGYTMNPNKPDVVRDKINRLKEDKKKLIKMGLKGKELVEEKFNWDEEEKKLIDFYEKILSNTT